MLFMASIQATPTRNVHSADGPQIVHVSEEGKAEVSYPVYDLESQQFLMNANGRLETTSFVNRPSAQKIVITNNWQDGSFGTVQAGHIGEESLNNEFKEEILSVESNKEESSMENCDEIDNTESVIQVMLDDDQCLTLEQKGRVLLEQDSRFFLLDNVGLQEITKRNDFIKQLQEEQLLVCRDNENDMEMLPTLQTMGELPCLEIGHTNAMINPFVEGPEGDSDKESDVDQYVDTHNGGEVLTVNQCNDLPNAETLDNERHDLDKNSLHVEELSNEESSEENVHKTVTSIDRNLEPIMTISMDYVIKELPPKLYLGQSYDGKKLYARLRELIPATRKTSRPVQKQIRLKSQLNTSTYKLRKIKSYNTRPAVQRSLNSTLNKTRIVDFDEKKTQTCKLSDEVMSSDPEDISYLLAALWYTNFSTSALDEHLTLIEKTVDSLMQLVSVKELIVGQNVIVTKVVKFVNGEVNVPFVVTGFISDVSEQGEDENWRFIYIPELLMENNKELMHEYGMSSGKLLHIAVVETATDLHTTTNYTTNVLVVYKSFTKLASELQKNSFSQCASPNVTRPMRLKVVSSHACAACGATFHTEPELCQHQETHKLEVKTEEPQTIIDENTTLKILDDSKIVLNEPHYSKMYVCFYCKKVFTRCSNLQRHMSIHFDPVVKTAEGSPTNTFEIQKSAEILGQSKGVFTCNMCTCSYFYASTLTRHIMTCHIDPTKTKKYVGEAHEEFS